MKSETQYYEVLTKTSTGDEDFSCKPVATLKAAESLADQFKNQPGDMRKVRIVKVSDVGGVDVQKTVKTYRRFEFGGDWKTV